MSAPNLTRREFNKRLLSGLGAAALVPGVASAAANAPFAQMTAGQSRSKLPLVTKAAAASIIVLADQPLRCHRRAATELQYHLRKITGADVPVVGESDVHDSRATLILVGQSRRVSALGIDTAALPAETFVVRTTPGTLILAGNDSEDPEPKLLADLPGAPIYTPASHGRTGTLYAVYDFLEDQLGCRWLWPGPTGEVIPRRETIEVGPLDIVETPVLFRRHMRSGFTRTYWDRCRATMPAFTERNRAAFERMAEDEQVWLKRMRMGEAFPLSYGHAFTTWWKAYGQTEPELFALLPNGQRGPYDAKKPEFTKMCVSNPKLVQRLIEGFKAQRAKDPGARFLNACENDGSAGWCTCAGCRAWDLTDAATRQEALHAGADGSDVDQAVATARDGLPVSLSNRYFRFFNALARELRKVAPDASVVTYAYSRYKDAPVGMALEPNILIGMNSTFNQYPMNAADFAEARRNYRGWLATRCSMFLRPNAVIFSPALGVPWSAAHQMGRDFRYALNNATLATDFDSLTGQFATAAPMYYVLARLHWDTHASVDDLLDEFYAGFGPAAPAVEEFFEHYERVVEATFNRPDIDQVLARIEPVGGRLARWRGMPVYYTPEVLAKGRAIISRACDAAAASGDAELIARVRVLELGQRHGELVLQALALRNRLHPDRVVKPTDTVDLTELMPVLNELFEVRRLLAETGAENVFFVADYELNTNWDMLLTSAWHRAQAQPAT